MDKNFYEDDVTLRRYRYPKDSVDFEVNLESLREMEEVVPLTKQERYELRSWVRKGYDVESNPWGYLDSDGFLMNYIQAYRLEFGYSSGPWDAWKGPASQPYWSVDIHGFVWPNDNFD